MQTDYTNQTLVWQGDIQPADAYLVHETLPEVHLDATGTYTAVLRVFRGGLPHDTQIVDNIESENEAIKTATALQSSYRPTVSKEDPVYAAR